MRGRSAGDARDRSLAEGTAGLRLDRIDFAALRRERRSDGWGTSDFTAFQLAGAGTSPG